MFLLLSVCSFETGANMGTARRDVEYDKSLLKEIT